MKTSLLIGGELMWHGTRLLISTSVLVIVIGAIFLAGKPELSSAQNEGFKSYQLLVFCGDSSLAAATFWHEVTDGGTVGRPLMGLKTICAGKKCSGGPVTLANALAQVPANVSAAIQAKVDKHQENLAGEGWFLACLGEGKEQPSGGNKPPEKKCEKPAPWFGDSSNGCTDIQTPAVAINSGAVTISICGYPVFRHIPRGFTRDFELEAYRRAVSERVQQQAGSRICCNKLRDAARSGTPCYPAVDVDCDGKPNQTDVVSENGISFPSIDLFTKPAGSSIDPFPPGLNPDDPDFLPDRTARDSKGVGECDCKWELIKGDLKCSPDGRQQHIYIATWRCPSTKAEVFTTKYAPATAPCQTPR